MVNFLINMVILFLLGGFVFGLILISMKLANPDLTEEIEEEVPLEGPGERCYTIRGDPDTVGPMYNHWLQQNPKVVVRETRVIPVYGGTFMYIFYSMKE